MAEEEEEKKIFLGVVSSKPSIQGQSGYNLFMTGAVQAHKSMCYVSLITPDAKWKETFNLFGHCVAYNIMPQGTQDHYNS